MNLQIFNFFNIRILVLEMMDELSTLSIAFSLASIGIFCLFFSSSDDDDQDGGHLIKSAQKIS